MRRVRVILTHLLFWLSRKAEDVSGFRLRWYNSVEGVTVACYDGSVAIPGLGHMTPFGAKELGQMLERAAEDALAEAARGRGSV